MTDLSELHTLFTGEIEQLDGSPFVRIPEREIEDGSLAIGDSYRFAVLERLPESRRPRSGKAGTTSAPVEVGERRVLEIEDLGEQGDGIARVGPGYIVFVEGADIGDRLEVEITEVRENFAFAQPVDGETAPR